VDGLRQSPNDVSRIGESECALATRMCLGLQRAWFGESRRAGAVRRGRRVLSNSTSEDTCMARRRTMSTQNRRRLMELQRLTRRELRTGRRGSIATLLRWAASRAARGLLRPRLDAEVWAGWPGLSVAPRWPRAVSCAWPPGLAHAALPCQGRLGRGWSGWAAMRAAPGKKEEVEGEKGGLT
jgi:hypothetical protein